MVDFRPTIDADSWTCPVPLRNHDRIVLGHGGGGRLTAELVEHLFLPALSPDADASALADSAVLSVELAPGERLVMSTDSYVVRPLFFPGGSIGELAVNGTINDLAMSGARPIGLTAGFVLMEGLALATLAAVADAMGNAARRAGVPIVTGDTKVVEANESDGVIISTAGVGVVPAGVDISPGRVVPGDVVIVSGSIGDHAVAVMSQREGLDFGGAVASDSAPLHELVASLISAGIDVHALRDPTRGGVAASLNEIASAAGVGIRLDDASLPVSPVVHGACSFLGLDPLELANEGKLLAFVPAQEADRAVEILRAQPYGKEAAVIGAATNEHPGVVAATTPLGATRIVDLPLGEALPRIC